MISRIRQHGQLLDGGLSRFNSRLVFRCARRGNKEIVFFARNANLTAQRLRFAGQPCPQAYGQADEKEEVMGGLTPMQAVRTTLRQRIGPSGGFLSTCPMQTVQHRRNLNFVSA